MIWQKQGYHAIDIGHADLSYEWMLRGNHNKVPDKYSNEAPEGYMVEEIMMRRMNRR